MTSRQMQDLRALEGRSVSLALADGSRIDDATLVSAGRGGTTTLWLFTQGSDLFVPVVSVVDGWESHTSVRRAA